ncbi:MAG TPA: hypothetical protein DCM62_02455 [Bacteroidales bacterium]|nr:hypothetical protein [Bacteroidales bacterium]
MQKLRIALLALLLLPVVNSCIPDTHHPVPFVHVDFAINVESPHVLALNAIHGHAIFSGGYAGIIIFRRSIDEFVAFDRACPHHPFDPCGRITQINAPIATCPCCQSSFLMLDGNIISGPSRFPLKTYRASFQHPWLRITNW